MGLAAARSRIAPADAAPRETAPPSARPRAYRFEIAADLGALDALEDRWNALADRVAASRQGFQSFAWLRAWAYCYDAGGGQIHILLGYADGDLALIWPLGASRRFSLKQLEFLGEPMCQYHDALVDTEAGGELIEAAFDHLGELSYDVFSLRRIRADSVLTMALLARGARAMRKERAPYIAFPSAATFAEFEKTLPSKARANRRRRMRRLNELGAITFERPDSPERADALLAIAMAFKRQWALTTGHYAPAVFDARFEACFRDAVRADDPHARLRIFAMHCDGRPIGVEISFGYKDRLFAHVLAPDPALVRYGIGNALADAAIQEAFESGYAVYDLLAPANPYKAAWTERSIEVTDFLLAGSRRGAVFGRIRGTIADGARALGKRAPVALVRALLMRKARRDGGG